MIEQEVYKAIKPLLEGYTEGLYWDFKKTLTDVSEITKDILAFSNSNYEGDSYIIVGVSESKSKDELTRISLSSEDRKRLNTDANYLYLPGKWNVHGLNADDIEKMKQFSAKLTEQLKSCMLISVPKCEFVPVCIKAKTLWLYVIVVKKTQGVFVSKKDLFAMYDNNKVVVKQGVLYVRVADTTWEAKTEVASATEHIRIWKKYIDWLESQNDLPQGNGQNV